MAQDINRVILIGNVTRDFELKTVGTSATSTVSFTIAVNGSKGKDGIQHTDFPSITAWGKAAEICAQYLHKGSKVAIDGRLQTRSYEKNGQRVYVTEVVADRVEFLTPRGDYQQVNTASDGEFVEVSDQELPF